jgi:hypothetical protein
MSIYATQEQLDDLESRLESEFVEKNNLDNLVTNIVNAMELAQVQSDWTQTDTKAEDYIKNKPNLAAVATSGAYSDLKGTPTIPGEYSLSAATPNTLGGIKVTSASGGDDPTKNYPVKLDSSDTAYVNVPHDNSPVTPGTYGPTATSDVKLANGSFFNVPKITVDGKGHVTGAQTIKMTLPNIVAQTISAATASDLGGIKVTAASGSEDAAKNYPVKLDNNSTAYVNVPWVNYSAGNGIKINDGKIVNNKPNLQTKNVVSNNSSAINNSTSENGSTYLNAVEDGVVVSSHNIKGTGGTTVASDLSGHITIHSESASSIDWNAITNKPTIPTDTNTAAYLNTNNNVAQSVPTNPEHLINGTVDLHKVSKTGNYNDLLDKPTIKGGIDRFDTQTAYAIDDIVVYDNRIYKFKSDHSAGAWTGTDADLLSDVYTGGTNISISDGVISATDTTYAAGNGISISGTNNAISVNAATNSIIGGLKLAQAAADVGTNGGNINAATTEPGRYYPVNITADNNVAYVNVPWTASTAVLPDWNADNSKAGYIDNKPNLAIETGKTSTIYSTAPATANVMTGDNYPFQLVGVLDATTGGTVIYVNTPSLPGPITTP